MCAGKLRGRLCINVFVVPVKVRERKVVMEEAGITHSLIHHQYRDEETAVIRGNPANDDAYGTLVVSFGKVLNGRSAGFNRTRSRYGNKRGGGLFKKRTRLRF